MFEQRAFKEAPKEVVNDAQFKAFVLTGKIDSTVIDALVEKMKQNITLSHREISLYRAASGEIESRLREAQKKNEKRPAQFYDLVVDKKDEPSKRAKEVTAKNEVSLDKLERQKYASDLVSFILRSGGHFAEKLHIKEDGSLSGGEVSTATLSLFAYFIPKTKEELYALFQKIETENPKLQVRFTADIKGAWIKYDVSLRQKI